MRLLSVILAALAGFGQPNTFMRNGSPSGTCLPGERAIQLDGAAGARNWDCDAGGVWVLPAATVPKLTSTYGDPSWITSLAGSKISGNISGSAATLTTPRAINGVNFNGSAAITVTASLPSNPTGCTAQFVQDIAADGTLTCVTVPYSQVSGTPTLAPIATSGSGSDISTGTVPPARLGSGTPGAGNYLRGDGAWTTPSGAGDTAGAASSVAGNVVTFADTSGKTLADSGRQLPARVYLSANRTNNNASANTIADVTGLSFAVTSGVRYRFRFYIQYTSAATTTGSRWSINGPATTELQYSSVYSTSATAQAVNFAVAYDIPAAASTSSLTAGNTAVIEGIVTPSANGTVIARFASEVSSSAVIALANRSFVEYEVIP